MDIKYLYENTDLTIQEIADSVGQTFKPVYNFVRREYSVEYQQERKKRSYRKSRLGERNPSFGKMAHNAVVAPKSDNKGYLLVIKPSWYTGRKGSRHVFQHSAVWCAFTGNTEVPAKHCVHHCDQNKTNNSYENLICVSMGDHQRLHAWLEGATTISKESTAKWLEAHSTEWFL